MSSGDPETRRRILEKTWRLMERSRGRQVSIDDIARAAGVSRQAVYLHFGSRTGLLVETVRYVDEAKDAGTRLETLRQATDGVQLLEALVDFWGNYLPEIHELAKALLAVRETDRAAAAAWDDRMELTRQCCRVIMRCLVRDGILAPEWTPEQGAEALYALLAVDVWERLTQESGWSSRQYVARMTTALKKIFVKQ
ncbi:MAG TPA: TetR/AcrR family transcriptional regulator [Anaerolineales bacterium]|nr:TetR/AcrR family transcriptional regulator [Anaerolineales bacterium]